MRDTDDGLDVSAVLGSRAHFVVLMALAGLGAQLLAMFVIRTLTDSPLGTGAILVCLAAMVVTWYACAELRARQVLAAAHVLSWQTRRSVDLVVWSRPVAPAPAVPVRRQRLTVADGRLCLDELCWDAALVGIDRSATASHRRSGVQLVVAGQPVRVLALPPSDPAYGWRTHGAAAADLAIADALERALHAPSVSPGPAAATS